MKKKVEDEAIGILKSYVKIDTTNPPGNEKSAAEFLGSILEDEDIPFEIFEPETGRANLIGRIEGNGEKRPLILLNHMDVVGVEPESWSVDPLSGKSQDGYIWGRGTLDMKGMGIMELMAMIMAKREEIKLSRDIIFLAVADEERGGDLGAKWMLENYPDKLDAEFVINEGSYGIQDIPLLSSPVFPCSTAEKGHIWMKVISKGKSGHGSMPPENHSIHNLIKSLNRVVKSDFPAELPPEVKELILSISSRIEPHLLPRLLKIIDSPVLWPLVRKILSRNARLRSMLNNTVSVNQLEGGYKVNVVPSNAEAVIDCRILPDIDSEKFVSRILEEARIEGESVEIMHSEEGTRSPIDTDLFSAFSSAIKEEYPDCVFAPGLLTGCSDSRFFRNKGIASYGLVPAPISVEDLLRIHGHDERIKVNDFLKGISVLYKVLKKIASPTS